MSRVHSTRMTLKRLLTGTVATSCSWPRTFDRPGQISKGVQPSKQNRPGIPCTSGSCAYTCDTDVADLLAPSYWLPMPMRSPGLEVSGTGKDKRSRFLMVYPLIRSNQWRGFLVDASRSKESRLLALDCCSVLRAMHSLGGSGATKAERCRISVTSVMGASG